jgi:hypothetical protein
MSADLSFKPSADLPIQAGSGSKGQVNHLSEYFFLTIKLYYFYYFEMFYE